MNKSTYLNNATVQEFIGWLAPLIDQPNSLIHSYTNLRPKYNWNCNSIYSAFENYRWGKKNFYETKEELDKLSYSLKKAIQIGDYITAKACCKGILKWGNVDKKGNTDKIDELDNNLPDYLNKVIDSLHPEITNTNNSYKDIKMNSGFTKIYSLIIDDFIIYDSRVGSALGLLVLNFCDSTGRTEIPKVIRFAYGNAQGKRTGPLNKRDPRRGGMTFPLLGRSDRDHIIHNVHANWILKEILSCSNSELKNLREFEAALFMIGYNVECSR